MKHFNLLLMTIGLFAAIEVSAQSYTPRSFRVELDDLPPNFSPTSLPNVYVGDTIRFVATGESDDDHTLTFTESPVGTPNIGPHLIPGTSDSVFNYVPTLAGHYEISSNMTFSTNFEFDVITPPITSVYNSEALEPVSFYPNPVKEGVNVSLNPSFSYTISVKDLGGATLASKSVSNTNGTNLNIDHLVKGAYILNISNGNSEPKAFKFVKE
jgi:plastocyanin